MIPTKLDSFNITKGNTYNEVLVFTEKDEATGVVYPVNLTQYIDIRQDIRVNVTKNSRLLHTVSLYNGIEISGTSHNILSIIIPFSITSNWNGGIYYRDLLVRDIWGDTYTICTGQIRVRENIT